MLLILIFFGVEHIPKEIKIFFDKFIVVPNILGIQAYDLVMCGWFCIRFIGFMHTGKTSSDFTNLFSSNNLKTNDDSHEMQFPQNIHIYIYVYTKFKLTKINEIKELKNILL